MAEAAVKLFDDRMFPVCGREFAAQHELQHPQDLLQFPLLQLDSVDPFWTGWEVWLRQWNCDLRRANYRRFNNYVVALQAAEDNQGIVLGWDSLVTGLIQRGKLFQLGEFESDAPGSFYLTWDANRPLSESAGRLRDWLVEIGKQ